MTGIILSVGSNRNDLGFARANVQCHRHRPTADLAVDDELGLTFGVIVPQRELLAAKRTRDCQWFKHVYFDLIAVHSSSYHGAFGPRSLRNSSRAMISG